MSQFPKASIFIAIGSATLCLFLFQNCGESQFSSAYDASSSLVDGEARVFIPSDNTIDGVPVDVVPVAGPVDNVTPADPVSIQPVQPHGPATDPQANDCLMSHLQVRFPGPGQRPEDSVVRIIHRAEMKDVSTQRVGDRWFVVANVDYYSVNYSCRSGEWSASGSDRYEFTTSINQGLNLTPIPANYMPSSGSRIMKNVVHTRLHGGEPLGEVISRSLFVLQEHRFNLRVLR